jgi:hypothetical protein
MKFRFPSFVVIYIIIMSLVCFILMASMFDNPPEFVAQSVNSRHFDGKARLFCWIITTSDTDNLNVSWTRNCDEAVFLVDVKRNVTHNSFKNTVLIDVPAHRKNESLWIKTRTSLHEIYKQHLNNFDWFVIVNADTEVSTKVLQEFLLQFDASEPQYFG